MLSRAKAMLLLNAVFLVASLEQPPEDLGPLAKETLFPPVKPAQTPTKVHRSQIQIDATTATTTPSKKPDFLEPFGDTRTNDSLLLMFAVPFGAHPF